MGRASEQRARQARAPTDDARPGTCARRADGRAHIRDGWLALVLVLALGALAAGCAGTSPGTRESDRPSGRLRVGLGVEGADARQVLRLPAGRPVTFVLVAQNAGGEPARLTFPSGQPYDLVVVRDGAEVWRWSAGRSFTQAVREETLGAGEQRIERIVWPATDGAGQPAPPGAYEARATLATSPPLDTPPVRFTLASP
jgi:hypothetical protein